jgi:hypothetical protein
MLCLSTICIELRVAIQKMFWSNFLWIESISLLLGMLAIIVASLSLLTFSPNCKLDSIQRKFDQNILQCQSINSLWATTTNSWLRTMDTYKRFRHATTEITNQVAIHTFMGHELQWESWSNDILQCQSINSLWATTTNSWLRTMDIST